MWLQCWTKVTPSWCTTHTAPSVGALVAGLHPAGRPRAQAPAGVKKIGTGARRQLIAVAAGLERSAVTTRKGRRRAEGEGRRKSRAAAEVAVAVSAVVRVAAVTAAEASKGGEAKSALANARTKAAPATVPAATMSSSVASERAARESARIDSAAPAVAPAVASAALAAAPAAAAPAAVPAATAAAVAASALAAKGGRAECAARRSPSDRLTATATGERMENAFRLPVTSIPWSDRSRRTVIGSDEVHTARTGKHGPLTLRRCALRANTVPPGQLRGGLRSLPRKLQNPSRPTTPRS
mmetsp:Transcript_25117/g.57058  ORF Transcript_25117/g.57058 Transcript_25117/m.57058 type:complete len:297 (-) Transcript_25117:1639-2529(-)